MEKLLVDTDLLRGYFRTRPIRRAYLFGSYSRSESNQDSDIDILVELDHSEPIGMKFFGFQIELEDLLNKKVDLVSSEGLSPHIRPFIEKDKLLIYERDTDR